MSTLVCPNCKVTGGNLIYGVIDSDVYDGVLHWVCLHCGTAFPRNFGDYKNRQEVSDDRVREYNARRK